MKNPGVQTTMKWDVTADIACGFGESLTSHFFTRVVRPVVRSQTRLTIRKLIQKPIRKIPKKILRY